MPYSGKDDPGLPSNVKDMPDSDRAQWVEIFNSAYNACIKDGKSVDTCETSAFKQANGAIKKKAATIFQSILDNLHDFGIKLGFLQKRSLSVPDMYNQVATAAYEDSATYGAWLVDIYAGDSGLFALFTLSGKLYTAPVTIDVSKNSATIPQFSEWQQVKEEFLPVMKTEQKLVIREKDGIVRWFLIAGTSIVNKNGQIDSSALFDDMIKKCEDGVTPYPYLTFFHLGKKFRMGSCDYLARDGVVLIASGTFDAGNKIAECMIRAYAEEPDYWGSSIGFWALAEEMVKIAQDLKLPMYTEGFLEEISILPEESACAIMTALRSTTKEVNRMDKRIEDALKVLANDPELAEEFIAMVDAVNRATEDEGLIHRSTDPTATTTDPAATTADPAPATVTDPTATTTDPAAPAAPVLEMDDALVQRVVEEIAQLPATKESFVELRTAIEQLTKDVQALHAVGIKRDKETAERFAKLERSEDDKRKEWLADQSARVINKVRVTHRPTQNQDPVTDEGNTSMADIASNTLSNLK